MLGSASVPGKSSHFVASFVGQGRDLWWYVQRDQHPRISQRGYSLGVWINDDDCVHAEEKVCKEMRTEKLPTMCLILLFAV